MRNIYIDLNGARVIVTRDGITRSRRFSYKKFGSLAMHEADKYADYLYTCTDKQFVKANRPIGRPKKSEYFASTMLDMC
jgi:hypothetical protein